jgi:hypothetical protein
MFWRDGSAKAALVDVSLVLSSSQQRPILRIARGRSREDRTPGQEMENPKWLLVWSSKNEVF